MATLKSVNHFAAMLTRYQANIDKTTLKMLFYFIKQINRTFTKNIKNEKKLSKC